MCLLCGRPTLAAYAVDNDIVVMNGAHTLSCHFLHVFESDVQYIYTEYTANCGSCARGKLVSIQSAMQHYFIDTEAGLLCKPASSAMNSKHSNQYVKLTN